MSIEKIQCGLDNNAQWNAVRARMLNEFYRNLDEQQVNLNNTLRKIPVGNKEALKGFLEDFEALLGMQQRSFLQQLAMNQELANTFGAKPKKCGAPRKRRLEPWRPLGLTVYSKRQP